MPPRLTALPLPCPGRPAAQGVPDVCSVRLGLQERSWYSGGVQTYMQGNEGHVQGNLGLRNLAGACEQWRLTGEYGHRNSFDFQGLFRLPRAGGGDWTPDVSAFRRSTNHGVDSSFADTMRGAELGVTRADGTSRLSYTWGWRSLAAAKNASRPVAAQRGDFLSDALRWSHVVDERDSATVHTEGWGARVASELGGLFPGARHRYAKQRVDWVWAAPLGGGVALNVNLGAGVIWSLDGASQLAGGSSDRSRSTSRGGTPEPRPPQPTAPRPRPGGEAAPLSPTPLAERFFLGGSDSVRGFAYRGLGPSAERRRGRGGGDGGDGGGAAAAAEDPGRDALGGDVFGSLYAGLVTRLPGQLGDLGGCAHAFVNGGSAALLCGAAYGGARRAEGAGAAPETTPLAALGGAVRRRAGELAATCRWSAGLGLVLPTPFGRFEANYVWVLAAQPGDYPKAGLQFGFAASPITPVGP
ncbi:hypothetical protein MNEG_3896 [Monoraphidium neglectum]|uniref:Bacterial surface antigen (D15) domain-containing protein n=1 Tax=Monoraphidium neglectum TaxID=145388 RepID=A0A0D2MU66_9CHLO|nr:hypothetical protein MNEG_3896 [Monoraphidium neglectum]KIZ04062.1 hypothetical protein MNEG_3896 [Monoraphidium neglectum]|eukprot:XP_013903081.1 hypothetical protein MNEG_3896 [Monoraphidium neglectum]